MNLTDIEIKDICEKISNGEKLSENYKERLFPVAHKEYELSYSEKMRREDLLANEDGVFPVPLQIEKVFLGSNVSENNWKNMLFFGDNLQLLKTIYEDKDPLIKGKVKGKVKLIYIDPPFATENDFKGSKGQKAYSDKVKGSEFIETIRRRLILAKEILDDNGSIFVHLDSKKVHYIKVIMDEIFGENYFKNEFVWCYRGMAVSENHFTRKHDTILFYTNGDNNTFNWQEIAEPLEESTIKKYKHKSKDGRRFRLHGRNLKGSPIQNNTDIDIKWLETNPELCRIDYLDEKKGTKPRDWFVMDYINVQSKERLGYPTQKPEKLIARLIKVATNEGDLVFDFFAGSGTTIAVAEKLRRRWIACDIGKLSIYTIQKRLLEIENSEELNSKLNQKTKYKKTHMPFMTINTGFYNLNEIFSLEENKYREFVMDLFEIENMEKKINGIKIDGERKDGYYCMIFEHWKFSEVLIDEEYLENLDMHIGSRIGSRLYIIAPVNYVNFLSDYYEIGDRRYYFLKVPYRFIEELHKTNFKKLRQPQSKSNINNLEDAVGFHFMKTPIVETEFIREKDIIQINIKKFISKYKDETTGKEMKNFESLSLVLIDNNYNGKQFKMSHSLFAEELLNIGIENNKDDTEENAIVDEDLIKFQLKSKDILGLPELKISECGQKIMIIYVDIYGNEFREEVDVYVEGDSNI